MSSLRDQLRALHAHPAVRAVVAAGRDGLLIDHAAGGGADGSDVDGGADPGAAEHLAALAPGLVAAAEAECAPKLSSEAANAARAAAAVMAMNNVYYRFVHLASNPEYGKLPARLRMNVIGNPGIEKDDFELFSLAVSAMNGCGMCIDSHERVLQQHGVKAETIQAAARIASVMQAVATVHATL